MIECIQDPNDQNLDAGLGNWTGDADWEAGPIHGQEGMMKFTLPGFAPNQFEEISYEDIKIPAEKNLNFYCIAYKEGPGDSAFLDTAIITDGTTTIEKHLSGTTLPSGWATAICLFTTPPGWNEENATLSIKLRNPYANEGIIYVDEFSLSYIEPTPTEFVQHLPIMGVG